MIIAPVMAKCLILDLCSIKLKLFIEQTETLYLTKILKTLKSIIHKKLNVTILQ